MIKMMKKLNLFNPFSVIKMKIARGKLVKNKIL